MGLSRWRIWKERMFETMSSGFEKWSLFLACVIKAFTRWYSSEKVLRALS